MDNLETSTSRKRQLKTTQNQYNLYLEMLESNTHFRENKVTPDKRNEVGNAWTQLVGQLNSSGGPQKSLTEWKRVFTDWKSQVRKRARIIKLSLAETGNTGEPEKELSELEKKLLYLTGEIVIDGIKGVPEIGMNSDSEVAKAVAEDNVEKKTEKKRSLEEKENAVGNEVLNGINSKLKKLIELKEEELEIKKQKLEFCKIKFQVKYGYEVEGNQ